MKANIVILLVSIATVVFFLFVSGEGILVPILFGFSTMGIGWVIKGTVNLIISKVKARTDKE